MIVSLKDFFAEGRFGAIALGAQQEDILRAVGVPPIWEGRPKVPYPMSEIWAYPQFRLQVNFSDGVSAMMYLHAPYFFEESRFPFADVAEEVMQDWRVFRVWLREAGLPFEERANGQRLLISIRGVCARFSDEPEKRDLIGIRVSMEAVPPWK